MIFGRKKKEATVAAAVEQGVAPVPTPAAANPAPAPAPPPNPAPQAAAPAASAPPLTAKAPDREKTDKRSRRAMESKMVAASFGEIISVLMHSKTYRKYSLADLEWMVVPAVLTQQFALAEAHKNNDSPPQPIAVAMWASVSPEVDEKLTANVAGPWRLTPDEWKSGDILWLIDAVGPRDVVGGLVGNLHKNVLQGRPLKLRGKDEQGNPMVKIQQVSA